LTSLAERESVSQSIANILIANQHHLELLRLDLLPYIKRAPRFLPPNLKYLRVNAFGYLTNTSPSSMVIELAAEQCPKLCGLEFYGRLVLQTITAISRFEKFVAYYFNILCKIIICFSLTFLAIRSRPMHEAELGAMFGSGSLRNLQGLILRGSENFKVLFSIINFSCYFQFAYFVYFKDRRLGGQRMSAS